MAKKPRWYDQNPEFDDYDLELSKTEKKKALHRLQGIGEKLGKLSPKQIKKLDTVDFVIEELLALSTISSKPAQNRQIGRIGKVLGRLESDEVVSLTRAIFEKTYSPEQQAKVLSWIDRMVSDDDQVKLFVKHFTAAEINSINQQLIWFEHGKQTGDEGLSAAALESLECYVMQVAVLS